jgi:inhibitor of KinA
MDEDFRIQPVGDSALVVELGDAIDPDLNRRVHSLAAAISRAALPGMLETIPAYRSLLVRYDPATVGFVEFARQITELGRTVNMDASTPGDLIEVPVVYGGAHGPDLAWVAEQSRLTSEEVVRRHSQVEYRVYMMGFTPGFPYMGKLDPALDVPRLANPRQRVPGGSVGIAQSQTGIYPFDSPGGWRIIGWTALRLFDPARQEPFRFAPGDRVRFVPVAAETS